MLRHLVRTVNLFDTAKSALFLCFLTACHPSGGGNPVRGLVYYESYDPRSLDPSLSTDVPTGEMITLLFDGLTEFDPDGRLLAGLSDRWTSDRAAQLFVFHLRPHITFHDGRPLVAADVKRALVRVLNPATHGGRVWPLLPIAGAADFADGRARDVRGIEVLGDTAIAFTLAEPLAVFPKFLAMPAASIVPSPVPVDFAQHPVGTGPWRFVSWEHDDYLRFAANSTYWGGAPLADSLTVRIVPEALTRAAEFLSGRLSVVEVPFGETVKWQQDHADWLKRKPALRPIYVPLNNQRGPLRDPRVRQAINHAVNVPEILRTVWNGRGVLAAGSTPPAAARAAPPACVRPSTTPSTCRRFCARSGPVAASSPPARFPPRWEGAIPAAVRTRTTRPRRGACFAKRGIPTASAFSCGVQGRTSSSAASRRRFRRSSRPWASPSKSSRAMRRVCGRQSAKARPTWRSPIGGPTTPTPTTSSIRCFIARAPARAATIPSIVIASPIP